MINEKKYVETEKSKWAKEKLLKLIEKGEISPASSSGREIEILKCDPLVVKALERDEKKGFPNLLATLSRADDQKYTLLKFCVQGNIEEETLYIIIKKFIWNYWGNEQGFFGDKNNKNTFETWRSNMSRDAKNIHQRYCDFFEIHPDPNFPDW
jgi:hypothetical protein